MPKSMKYMPVSGLQPVAVRANATNIAPKVILANARMACPFPGMSAAARHPGHGDNDDPAHGSHDQRGHHSPYQKRFNPAPQRPASPHARPQTPWHEYQHADSHQRPRSIGSEGRQQ